MMASLIWPLVMPSMWLIYTIIIALYLLHKKKLKLAKYVLCFWVIVLLSIALFPIGDLLLWPLESQYKIKPNIKDPKAIILLGGSEEIVQTQATDLPHLNGHATRYITTIQLARTYPKAKIIISGGVGHVNDSQLEEAEIGKAILLSAGINKKRIILEHQSHNTIENAQYTKLIVEKLFGSTKGPFILVTSASHMPRSMGLFCSQDFTHVVPYPTAFLSQDSFRRIKIDLPDHLGQLDFAVHEWLGIWVNRLLGKSDKLIVDAC